MATCWTVLSEESFDHKRKQLDMIVMVTLLFASPSLSVSETYHVEPITNHFPADTHGHNRIIYRESDVNYDLLNTSCLSDYSSRLKYIQVCLCVN